MLIAVEKKKNILNIKMYVYMCICVREEKDT